MAKTPIPNAPETNTCFCMEDCKQCVCGPNEKILRGWSERKLPAMTIEQREWCLREISSVEGFYREDYEKCPDDALARGVLQAWVSFCRDKGII